MNEPHFEGSLKKEYEEIVVDELYWVECRKCGFKWKSLMLEWIKNPSCSRCGSNQTRFGAKVERKE